MDSSYKGRRVVLMGNKSTAVHWMEGKTMINKMNSASSPQIFAIEVQLV